jgi:hypothetical protein
MRPRQPTVRCVPVANYNGGQRWQATERGTYLGGLSDSDGFGCCLECGPVADEIYVGLCVEATDSDGLSLLLSQPQLHAKPALADDGVNADGIQKRIETGFRQFPIGHAPGDSETGAEHGCDMTLTGGA